MCRSAAIPAGSDRFTSATATAVDSLQASLGMAQTGSLALGQLVFVPTPVRVTAVKATMGSAVSGGEPVLEATSTTRVVTVALDASQLAEVKTGDAVTIVLTDGRDTPGVISAVGTTVSAPTSDGPPGSASSGPSTVQVTITPSDPGATGTLDLAPVTVAITGADVAPSLAVPVTALATERGQPAVDVVDAHGRRHLVAVSVGIVDDALGRVQVSGAGLAVGERVVVPA